MGQRIVVFHAFLASLVPIASAVGVAPSGLTSPDFYRSRRFRTANSTPMGASIRDSASSESAVAVLDDLSRKSRVMLAHNEDGEAHKLLTWNAGGGVPTPEYLGGEWEEEHDGMFSAIEKMTGVLLFELAGCEEVDKKYDARYAAMRKTYAGLFEAAGEESDWKKHVKRLKEGTVAQLLGGIGEELPPWAGTDCTFPAAIGNFLELCPGRPVADKACKGPSKETSFALGSEGCWKKRGALPVYGAAFFELYGLRQDETKTKEYWEKYTEGLQKQDAVPGKGCKPGEGFPMKAGQPGKHVLSKHKDEVEYDDKTKVKTPVMFTKEVWSMTAAWDAIILELTALSIKILNARGGAEKQIDAQNTDKTYKSITVIDDTIAAKTITKIVRGAQDFLHPDVVFLQEADMVGADEWTPGWLSYDNKKADLDTALYVRKQFGGGIDDEVSDALQGAWNSMMGSMTEALGSERDKKMMESLEVKDLGALEEAKKAEDKDTQKKVKAAEEAFWKKAPYNSVPERLLEFLPEIHVEAWGEDKVEVEKKDKEGKETKETVLKREHNAKTQRSSFDGLMGKKSGLGYAQAPHLVTVAVTAEEPRVLLFSIHSDGDGYFCAQYLNLAEQFYKEVTKTHPLARMYIGMDANVQPAPSHPSHEPKKGFTYIQLEKVLSVHMPKMKMLDPGSETVKKVRTFLQTQFSKIGKDDEERKDLLFVYPDVPGGGETTVYNKYDTKANKLIAKHKSDTTEGMEERNSKPVYYPKNEWPVDHFMSYATVTGTSVATKEEEHAVVKGAKSVAGKICVALKRAVRKTTYSVKSCFTKVKGKATDKTTPPADDSDWTKIGKAVGQAALEELKKATKK